MSRPAQAAPTNVPITGEIEQLVLSDPTTTDPYARGTIVVGGESIILPRNLLIDLPANRLSLWQIFDQAPLECKLLQESGLAKTDACNTSGMGGIATITAVRTNAGNVIAGDVFIQKAVEAVTGTVTYIDYTNGFFRVNGIAGDPITGTIIRLNDPTSRHTIQQGPGCAPGSASVNCSADPRFTLDPDNYVITFSTGYPACIPSTVSRTTQTALPATTSIPVISAIPAGTIIQAAADGTGDLMCPSTNRTPNVLLEPPVADSRRFAPIMLGDSVTAEGNFENIGGVHFLSAHTMSIHKALATRNVPDQPDYLFLEEVFIGAPGFENQRINALWIGFTTLAPTDVDIWSIHRDPVNNEIHELPLASVRGCDLAAGLGTCSSQGLVNAGANIFRIRYDVDFLLAATGNPPGGADARLSPCAQLTPRFGPSVCPAGGTFAENFAVMSPIPHEIQARTGHAQVNPGLLTLDINGAEATNGQYLFPLGLNLGGIETAEFAEIDLNQMSKPTIFEGIPWNLDRRLGPSGCLNGNPPQCETAAVGDLAFALDPFPFSGLDPRTQADFAVPAIPPALPTTGGLPKIQYGVTALNNSILSFDPLNDRTSGVRNRIFSYVDPVLGIFSGDSTILSCATGTFPANCPLDPPFSAADVLIRPAVGLGLSLNVTSPTRATTQTVSGTIQAGITPVVSVNTAATVGAVSLSPDGTAWSAQISNMPAGMNVVTVNAADPVSGNTDRAAAGINIIFPDGSFSGKGTVSAADALKALRISIGLVTPTAEDMLHGDCHPQGAPDGVVGLSDALLILRKAIGLVSF